MHKKLILLPLLPALLLSACGKSEPAHGPFKTEVALDGVMKPEGCLGLDQYFQEVRAMDPAMPVMEVTTSLRTESKYSVRQNFRRLLAYGSALAEAKPLGELPDFQNVSQEGCEKLTVSAADGAVEAYEIVGHTDKSLRAEDEDGFGFEYTWLSEKRMRITHRYRAYDLPCGKSDNPITVIATKVIDWSGNPPATMKVDDDLVKNIAETVGADPAEAQASDGQVSLASLKALLDRDPRPELLTCTGQAAPTPGPAPAPAPAPAPENPNPADPGSDPAPAPAPTPPPPPTPENPNPGEEGPAPGPTTPTPPPEEGSNSPWWWPF